MENQDFEILKYADEHREQLLDVWEKSVHATYFFFEIREFSIYQSIDKSDRFS